MLDEDKITAEDVIKFIKASSVLNKIDNKKLLKLNDHKSVLKFNNKYNEKSSKKILFKIEI